MLNRPANLSQMDSWKSWLASRQSNEFINNTSKDRLFEAFNHTTPDDKCKQSLLDHDQTVFLFKQNLGNSKVNIFHHLTKEGGNLYIPEENLAAIQGVGTGTTCIIISDIQTILALPVQQTQRVPSA